MENNKKGLDNKFWFVSNITGVCLSCLSAMHLRKGRPHLWDLQRVWGTSVRKAAEEQETSRQHPVPQANGAFYIPPSISITIAATRPRVRHIADDWWGGRTRKCLSEEPAAAGEEAVDRKRYERSS